MVTGSKSREGGRLQGVVCCQRAPPPFILSRAVPGRAKNGNKHNRLPKDKSDLPAKLHLDGKQATIGRPIGSVDRHCLWPGPCQVGLDLIFRVFAAFVCWFGLTSGPFL